MKIDFLGLKNLTIIDHAIKLIKQNHDIKIDINKLPLDNLKTFELICEGKTSGVFQLESEGLKEVLRKLQPEKFEDKIMLEIKAVKQLEFVHLAQARNYLEAYKLEVGLLINFGANRLEFKRVYNKKHL